MKYTQSMLNTGHKAVERVDLKRERVFDMGRMLATIEFEHAVSRLTTCPRSPP